MYLILIALASIFVIRPFICRANLPYFLLGLLATLIFGIGFFIGLYWRM